MRVDRPGRGRLAIALAVSLAGCQVGDLELSGKACPCTTGWSCDVATNTCVEGAQPDTDAGSDASTDASTDAGVDGGCEFVAGTSPGLEGPHGWPTCFNGVDDDCDGFSDEDDADCSTLYSIVRAPAAPNVDGDCGEYYQAQSVILRTDATNVAVLWLMWDDTALHLCAEIRDDSLDATYTDPASDRDEPIYADDALELLFDVDDDAGPSMNPGDYKLFVNVANVQADSEDLQVSWSMDFASSVQTDGTLNSDGDVDNGFTVELSAPWAAWGVVVPTAQTVWGGDLVWKDLDDVAGTLRSTQIWSSTLGINVPDGFGDLLFLD